MARPAAGESLTAALSAPDLSSNQSKSGASGLPAPFQPYTVSLRTVEMVIIDPPSPRRLLVGILLAAAIVFLQLLGR